MTTIVKAYTKHEYCAAVRCSKLQVVSSAEGRFKCHEFPRDCIMSAKQMHRWLTDNKFLLLKEIENGSSEHEDVSDGVERCRVTYAHEKGPSTLP